MLSRLEQVADNTTGMGLFPILAIHLMVKVRLYDPHGSLPTQSILCFSDSELYSVILVGPFQLRKL